MYFIIKEEYIIPQRGRPKGSKNVRKTSKPNVKATVKKTCSACPPDLAEKPIKNFYRTRSSLNSDGYLSVCKDCIIERCYDGATDEVNVDALKVMLRQLDKPYVEKVYQASITEYHKRYPRGTINPKDGSYIIGLYFKNINTLNQFRVMDWDAGVEWEKRASSKVDSTKVENQSIEPTKSRDSEESYFIEDEDFEVTDNMIHLFGQGFKKNEYKAMWDKYNFLKNSYPDITNLHTEALVTYVRFKVKEEFATATGNVIDAEKWNKAATEASKQAKINPSQLSKSDLQGGLNSFSELFQAVEQHDDFISILPQFKFAPNDAIDFNIWCLINYLRSLEGKPLCEYQDVYKFYDERKKEYVEQYGDPYGIFTDDPTESNRENIKKFISLPNDYSDISEEEGDDL